MGANEWIATASMLVAVIALVFSIWQASLQRRREKVMLEPEIKGSITTHLNDGNVGVVKQGVVNCGLGPAKIVMFQPEYKGVACSLHELLDQAAGDVNYRKNQVTTLAIGSSIPPQKVIEFVKLTCKASNQEDLDQFGDKFEHAKVRIRYKSFIGDEEHEFLVGE